MQRLFDSNGNHIANLYGERLHTPAGDNIGRRISGKFFVDISGNYLGEIVSGNRLLRRSDSIYNGTNYGNSGTSGNIGNAGDPGNTGSIGNLSGLVDIDKNKLR